MSDEIPKLLIKVRQLINLTQGEFDRIGIDSGRWYRSLDYYGFYLTHRETLFYFGCFIEPWITYSTPFFLQVDLKLKENESLCEEALLRADFAIQKDGSYLLPIRLPVPLPPGEDAARGELVSQVQRAINIVSNRLKPI